MKKREPQKYIVIEEFPQFETREALLEAQKKTMEEMVLFWTRKRQEAAKCDAEFA